jgi:hypothetical protein
MSRSYTSSPPSAFMACGETDLALWDSNYDIEVTFNGVTFQMSFMKIYQVFEKFLRGHRDGLTDRQTYR